MKTLSIIFLFFILLAEDSCNQSISKQDAKSNLQKLLRMQISDSIKITDYEQSGGIGADLTEIFIVHFTHDEFNKIFKKINPQKFKNIDVDLYGFTVEQNNKMTSAIFDSKNYTIKYTYHSQ